MIRLAIVGGAGNILHAPINDTCHHHDVGGDLTLIHSLAAGEVIRLGIIRFRSEFASDDNVRDRLKMGLDDYSSSMRVCLALERVERGDELVPLLLSSTAVKSKGQVGEGRSNICTKFAPVVTFILFNLKSSILEGWGARLDRGGLGGTEARVDPVRKGWTRRSTAVARKAGFLTRQHRRKSWASGGLRERGVKVSGKEEGGRTRRHQHMTSSLYRTFRLIL